MAARKGGAAAPVKQKLRKSHGPKKKMFHCWDSTTRLALARCGVLKKEYNFEAFEQSCNARGIKSDVRELWEMFRILPDAAARKEFYAHIKENAEIASKKVADRQKKSLTKAK